nr:MAG TPA: hypothetical protein [Caudoviricetes sp.]
MTGRTARKATRSHRPAHRRHELLNAKEIQL